MYRLIALTLAFGAIAAPASAQTDEAPLYLHCVAPIPEDHSASEWRDAIYKFDGVWIARWYPNQGEFIYEIDKNFGGGFHPHLAVSPAAISYTIHTAGSLHSALWINRTTGAYRVQRTWFGNPDLDVTGSCSRTDAPSPPETQF